VCRAVDHTVAGRSRLGGCVAHGDPHPTNIRIRDERVVLLDWDESRVDVGALDLSALPPEVAAMDEQQRHDAEQAAHAWEAALFWTSAPEYAQRRFAKLD
jgi:Ser/Thr protein kinase RdoA (MazF antagonist)